MNKKLLRKKLALMLANLKKKRKYYCEVEYLESSGTQYIDTGFIPTGNTGIDMRFLITGRGSGGSDSNIIMSGGDSAGYRCGFGYRSSSDTTYGNTLQVSGICATGVSWENYGMTEKVPHTVLYNYDNQKKCYLDGELQRENIPYGTATVTYPMFIFSSNMNGTSWRTSSFKLYYCKIVDDGVLVRDFIPVLDWDMTPCMYDRVTEQLFYNVGTGDFIAGREIHPVEYLESSTTNVRISTGILLDTFPFTAKVSVSSKAAYSPFYQVIVGTTNSTNQYLIGLKSGDPDFTMKYNNVTKTVGVVPVADKKYEISTTLTASSMTMNIDGIDYSYNQTLTANNEELGLFPQSYNTSLMRIYDAQLIKNNTLVRDFIPAIDENGIGFMFDRVTHTIYDNAGTGAFLYPAREVECLEGTGTQYIDTGYIPNQDTRIISEFEYTKTPNNNGFVFGAGYSATDRAFELYTWTNNWNSPYGNINIIFGTSASLLTSGKIYSDKNKNTILIRYSDGTEQTGRTDYTTFTVTNRNMWLFAINRGNTTFLADCVKLYSLKAYDNNTLVRDMIPVFKDGVSGMWDKQNGIMYANSGTGTFSVGKIVEPEYE